MAINKIDLLQVNETLSAAFNSRKFQLASIAIDTSMDIEGGGVEEIGNYLYRSQSTTTPTDSTGSDAGDVYLYVSDDGSGVGTAEILTTAPTYSQERAGFYYNQKKCIYYAYKTGGNFTKKTRYGYLSGDRALNDFIVGGVLTADSIDEKTTNEGVKIINNAHSYVNVPPSSSSTEAVLAAALAADGYESDVWYPASGVIITSTDRFGLSAIKQVSNTDIKIKATNYSASYAIYNDYALTSCEYWTITVTKTPLV